MTSQHLSTRVQRVLTGGATGTWQAIFALAKMPGVVDLGQGYPDFEGSLEAREAAAKVLLENPRLNQYSPVTGLPSIRESIAKFYNNTYDAKLNPETNIVVHAGATEIIFNAIQAFVNAGDEVVLFEPFFPWYLPIIKYVGGIPKVITLQAPGFEIKEEMVNLVVNDKTKLLIYNTPHNPTGHIATRPELDIIAKACIKHDVIALADEVYEGTVFNPEKHLRLVDSDGMLSRTLTMGSASKLLSLTGWRVGWVYGEEELVAPMKAIHGYNTFCAPTPLQQGVSVALDSLKKDSFEELKILLQENYNRLSAELKKLNLEPCPVEGGYFLVADASSYKMKDMEFCEWLAKNKNVAAVPMSVFYYNEPSRCLIRFALCKKRETMDQVIKNLANN